MGEEGGDVATDKGPGNVPGSPDPDLHTTLSGSKIRKVVLPSYECHGELLK